MNSQKDGFIKRREFITRGAAAALAASIAPKAVFGAVEDAFHEIPASQLPTRIFGRTGARIPLFWTQLIVTAGERVRRESVC